MIKRLNPTPRWSDATSYQGVAHFVEVPPDTSLPFADQVQQLLVLAEKTLTKLGSSTSSLLSATIYLTDRANLEALNQAWESWLPFGCAPARACVLAALVDPQMQVEIAFVAAAPIN